MKVILALAIASLALAPAAAKPAAQCRDAKSGKFIKCSTPGSVAATPAAVMAESPAKVNVDKNGKCHVADGPKKGQFTACPKK